MSYQANNVSIHRAENGYVMSLNGWGRQVVLVAKGVDELAGLLKGIEWVTESPLPPAEQPAMAPTQTAGRW